MTNFVTKGGGEKERFATGAQRDTQDGKPLFHLIPIETLDLLQSLYSKVRLVVDRTNPPVTSLCPEDETRRDLIPDTFLNRLGGLLKRGADKYGDDNWKKGIKLLRIYASAFRHSVLWYAGDTSEDHATAAAWNWMAIIDTEHRIARGELPDDLADAGPMFHHRAREK